MALKFNDLAKRSKTSIQQKIALLEKEKLEIEKKNALFNKMTPAQKRVAIAEDVREQIKKEKYVPTSGVYVELNEFSVPEGQEDSLAEKQLCEIINGLPNCDVCARGAMFVSGLRVFNSLRVKDVKDYESLFYGDNILGSDIISPYENLFFDKKQTSLMEICFEAVSIDEGNNHPDDFCSTRISKKDIDAALRYGQSFSEDNDRLDEIAKNIIRNKGDFIIPEKYYK